MMKYFIKIIFLFFYIIAPSFASCHVSDCEDKDFIELGKEYPCVGFFSCSDGIFGSGTLIDSNEPQLCGRVIITCAHIFLNDQKGNSEDIKFSIKDNPPRSGKFYIHPEFEEFYRKYGMEHNTSFDIAIFILNEPIHNITGASLNLDAEYEKLLDAEFTSVGFGATGHVLGKYQIIDMEKRASYAKSRLVDNLPNEEKTHHLVFYDNNGTKNDILIIRKKDSIVTLTPYVSSAYIDQQNTLETFRQPAGVGRQGDSGGGCFDASNSLIGIISGGNGPIKPVEVVFAQSYFLAYEEGLKKLVEDAQKKYQEAFKALEDDPEKLKEFSLQNEAPKMLSVIDNEIEMMKIMNSKYEKEVFYSKESVYPDCVPQSLLDEKSFCFDHIIQKVNMDIVVASFHREWILNMLKGLTAPQRQVSMMP